MVVLFGYEFAAAIHASHLAVSDGSALHGAPCLKSPWLPGCSR